MLLELPKLSKVNVKLDDHTLDVRMLSALKRKSVPPSKLEQNRQKLAQFLQKSLEPDWPKQKDGARPAGMSTAIIAYVYKTTIKHLST